MGVLRVTREAVAAMKSKGKWIEIDDTKIVRHQFIIKYILNKHGLVMFTFNFISNTHIKPTRLLVLGSVLIMCCL